MLLALLELLEHRGDREPQACEVPAARSDQWALVVPRVIEVARARWDQLDRRGRPGCPVWWAHGVLLELWG